MLLRHLEMQCVSQAAIELCAIGRAEHHAEFPTVNPVALGSELLSHTIVKSGVRQWIGNRYADVVRPGGAHQLDCLLNLFQTFPWVAKLKKIARANTMLLQ